MIPDFSDILFVLAKQEVDFVIVGGVAAIMYGSEQVTEDIDICCDFSAANLMRLQSAIADLNPVHRMTPNRRRLELTPESAQRYNNLYLDTDAGQIDCISEVKGVGTYECVRRKSCVVHIQGCAFRVLDLDALIASKKAMARPRDQEAVRRLEAIRRLMKKLDSENNEQPM